MTPEQALACIEQERLDVLAEGMSEADCNMIAAYVLASAYRKLANAQTEEVIKPEDPGEEYDGWAEKESAEELLREIRQMTDNVGIVRKIEDYFMICAKCEIENCPELGCLGCRRLSNRVAKIDAALDKLAAPKSGDWDGINASLSQVGRIRALVKRAEDETELYRGQLHDANVALAEAKAIVSPRGK